MNESEPCAEIEGGFNSSDNLESRNIGKTHRGLSEALVGTLPESGLHSLLLSS